MVLEEAPKYTSLLVILFYCYSYIQEPFILCSSLCLMYTFHLFSFNDMYNCTLFSIEKVKC